MPYLISMVRYRSDSLQQAVHVVASMLEGVFVAFVNEFSTCGLPDVGRPFGDLALCG